MKLAIIGSREIKSVEMEKYVSSVDEIVSGGARGVDFCAAEYARNKNIRLTEFLPQYSRFGRAAPLVRNKKIVDYADEILVFWNGHSKGTRFVIEYARKQGKPCRVIILEK